MSSGFNLKEEQRYAIYEGDGKDLLVSASAGSGKTFVMIERLIRLITAKKLKMGELLAVTFTEKAASEMKEKLSEALIKAINDGKKELKAELLDLPMADICTIDAFCSRLVKRYFYELSIGRDFEILSEADSARLTQEALKITFDKYYEAGDADFLQLINRFSERRTDEALRNLVLRIYRVANSEADPDKWLDITDAIYSEEGLNKLEADMLTAVKEKLSVVKRTLIAGKNTALKHNLTGYPEHFDLLVQSVDGLISLKSVYELNGLEFSFEGRLPSSKNFTDEQKEVKEELQKLKRNAKIKIEDLIKIIPPKEKARADILATKTDYLTLKMLVREFSENFFSLKTEENKFDFDDVERFTLKLLRNDNVRAVVKAKYKNIFIDEYQDVNGVQEEIFNLLSSNNLFMVGDVKQSIYGFRGCNPQLFENKFNALSKTGQAITLNYNFRSADEILSKVNDIFDNVITEENFALDYKSSSRLLSGGLYQGAGRVMLHIINKPRRQREVFAPEIYDIVKESEKVERLDDDYVALQVKNIIEEELGKDFYDIKQKRFRPVTLKDIAILCRKKTGGTVALIKGLSKNGIRVVSEVETNILETKEVKLLTTFLRLIDCFYQDAPLAVCLKSRIGGLTATELAEIRGQGIELLKDTVTDNSKITFVDCFNAVKKSSGALAIKLQEFDAYVKKLRFMSDFKGARYVLDTLIKDKNLSAYTLIGKLGDIKEKKVERFLAEASVSGRELSVREFLFKIDNSPESFTLSETAGGDAVTIMTAHKSKGLEFPVVIVVGLESKFGQLDVKEKVLIDRDYGISLKTYFDDERSVKSNLYRELLKHVITMRSQRDEIRLFYVATTRAKYSLHLISVEKTAPVVHLSEADGTRYFEFIPESFPKNTVQHDQLLAEHIDDTRKVFVSVKDQETVELIKRNLSFNYPFPSDVALKLKTSVTANLSGEDFSNKSLPIDGEEAVINDPVHRGTVTAEEGITAHKVLENFDFSNINDVDAELKRQVFAGLITQDELSTLDVGKLKKTLSLGIFNELCGYELHREQYFVTQVPAREVFEGLDTNEPVLLQGIVDLLAINGEEAIIVDYKYSGKSKENLFKTYGKQLKLYSRAVENSLKLKVKKAVIVSLLSGEAVEVAVDL